MSVRRSHYLPKEGHLTDGYLVSDGRNVEESLAYSLVRDALFLDLGDCYAQDSSDLAVQEDI